MRLVVVPTQAPGRPKRKHTIKNLLCSVVLLLVVAGTFLYFRPLPAGTAEFRLPDTPITGTAALAWPSTGQAALSAEGYNFIATNKTASTISTASMTKVITVLCVLEKHPLKPGETGPTLVMTAEDVERMRREAARGGTRLPIVEGEKLTQYQAIQAIMLPSANNIADTLAIWAFGSIDAYLKYANTYVASHGMSHTTLVGDASGFDERTVSTTTDLVQLAKLAMQNPVVMEIAGQRTAEFQTAGIVQNHNRMLDGGVLTGLKTGLNDGNTGSLVFTATVGEGREAIKLAGVVADAGGFLTAQTSAQALAESAADDFPTTTYLHKGDQIGTFRTAWGKTVPITVAHDVSLKHWRESKLYPHIDTELAASGVSPATIAAVNLRADGRSASAPLLITPSAGPSVAWRLTHIR